MMKNGKPVRTPFRFAVLMFIAVGIAFVASAQATRAPEEEVVWQTDRARAQAALTNNVDRILSFYDNDSVFTGTKPATAGIEQLRPLWEGWVSRNDYRLVWDVKTVAIDPSGDFAFSSGTFKQTYSLKGQHHADEGNYWVVWKKQENGTWKVIVDQP